jgi:hypothetical protein
VKRAPILASFDAAFCSLRTRARQGSNSGSLASPLGSQFGPTLNFVQGAPFWTHTPSPPLPSLCLLISVSSDDLMDQNYIKAATRLRDEMASPSSPSSISFRRTSNPISTVQPWQSCAPVTSRARQHRKPNRSKSSSTDSANALS